jgi:hypothetical protein
MVDGQVKAQGLPGEVLRPDLISEAYHLPVQVIPNPIDQSPLVLPDTPPALTCTCSAGASVGHPPQILNENNR